MLLHVTQTVLSATFCMGQVCHSLFPKNQVYIENDRRPSQGQLKTYPKRKGRKLSRTWPLMGWRTAWPKLPAQLACRTTVALDPPPPLSWPAQNGYVLFTNSFAVGTHTVSLPTQKDRKIFKGERRTSEGAHPPFQMQSTLRKHMQYALPTSSSLLFCFCET